MDDLAEAGLELERIETAKRLDSLLISRGWKLGSRRGQHAPFTFSARQHVPDSIHVILDAVLPEATAREILALVAQHGFCAPPGREHRPQRREMRSGSATAPDPEPLKIEPSGR